MAKKKKNFYAVPVGLKPGIYKTWDECKPNVIGVKGAVFEGFETLEEAEAFMKGQKLDNNAQSSGSEEGSTKKKKKTLTAAEKKELLKKELDLTLQYSSQQDSIVFYTDGSFNMKVENCPYTYGLVLVENNEIVHTDKGYGDNAEARKMNNVAGELLGAMKGILYAINAGKKNICVFHDYEGIAAWVKGDWKAKNDMVKKYVEFMHKKQAEFGLNFHFIKVKGHIGNPFNEKADQLAEEALAEWKLQNVK